MFYFLFQTTVDVERTAKIAMEIALIANALDAKSRRKDVMADTTGWNQTNTQLSNQACFYE